MMLTEKESGAHWCPFSRVAILRDDGSVEPNSTSYNRLDEDNGTLVPAGSFCIGSRCMAWRWIDSGTQRWKTWEGYHYPPELSTNSEERVAWINENVKEPDERPDDVPASWVWQPAEVAFTDQRYPYVKAPRWLQPEEEAKANRHGYCSLMERGNG